MIDSNLVAINLVDKLTNTLIFDYPIIYYWSGEEELEKLFLDENFSNVIFKKLTNKNIFNIKIFISYVFQNENEEYEAIKREFVLKDVIEIPEKFYDDSVKDILSYLYKCSFKVEPNENETIQTIFDKIQTKYPHKINKDVVAKYIESTLSTDDNSIDKVDIDKIVKRFLDNIS